MASERDAAVARVVEAYRAEAEHFHRTYHAVDEQHDRWEDCDLHACEEARATLGPLLDRAPAGEGARMVPWQDAARVARYLFTSSVLHHDREHGPAGRWRECENVSCRLSREAIDVIAVPDPHAPQGDLRRSNDG